MQRKDIFERLDLIRQTAELDPRVARELECQLREDFIKYVADPVSAQDNFLYMKAADVLSSSEIKFNRSN